MPMLLPRRPFSLTTAIVMAALSAVLTVASWVLHTAFLSRMNALLDTSSGRLEVGLAGYLDVLWVAEPAKVLIVAAGILLWRAMRVRSDAARVAAALAMTGCALAALAAVVHDGILFVAIFFLSALASAANSLSGGSGLPNGDVLGLGVASIVVNTMLLVVAGTTAILLSMRRWREYCAAERPYTRHPPTSIVTR